MDKKEGSDVDYASSYPLCIEGTAWGMPRANIVTTESVGRRSSRLSPPVMCKRGFFNQKEEDGVISARQLITDIRNKNDPNFTMKAIARGWSTNSIPYDEVFLKEYIKAAVATKKFDAIDLSSLISNFGGVARSSTNSSVAAAGGGAGLFASDSSAANPFHVVTIPPKNSILLTMIKYGFLFFVGYAVLNALSDSVGGGGGIFLEDHGRDEGRRA